MSREKSQFKKGWKGGPGRPRMIPELNDIPNITRDTLRKLLSKFLQMDKASVLEICQNPATPLVELMVASVAIKVIEQGDATRFDFLLSRIVGKVKDELEVTAHKPVVIERRDGAQVVLGTEQDREELGNGSG